MGQFNLVHTFLSSMFSPIPVLFVWVYEQLSAGREGLASVESRPGCTDTSRSPSPSAQQKKKKKSRVGEQTANSPAGCSREDKIPGESAGRWKGQEVQKARDDLGLGSNYLRSLHVTSGGWAGPRVSICQRPSGTDGKLTARHKVWRRLAQQSRAGGHTRGGRGDLDDGRDDGLRINISYHMLTQTAPRVVELM